MFNRRPCLSVLVHLLDPAGRSTSSRIITLPTSTLEISLSGRKSIPPANLGRETEAKAEKESSL